MSGARCSVRGMDENSEVHTQFFDSNTAALLDRDAASTGHSIWADVTWKYQGGAPDERNMYQLVRTDAGWKIAVLTPLELR